MMHDDNIDDAMTWQHWYNNDDNAMLTTAIEITMMATLMSQTRITWE